MMGKDFSEVGFKKGGRHRTQTTKRKPHLLWMFEYKDTKILLEKIDEIGQRIVPLVSDSTPSKNSGRANCNHSGQCKHSKIKEGQKISKATHKYTRQKKEGCGRVSEAI